MKNEFQHSNCYMYRIFDDSNVMDVVIFCRALLWYWWHHATCQICVVSFDAYQLALLDLPLYLMNNHLPTKITDINSVMQRIVLWYHLAWSNAEKPLYILSEGCAHWPYAIKGMPGRTTDAERGKFRRQRHGWLLLALLELLRDKTNEWIVRIVVVL